MKTQIAISQQTRVKAQQAKKYIQTRYNLQRCKEQQRDCQWRVFEERVKEMNLCIESKDKLRKSILHQQMQYCRRKRQKISKKHFESIKVIGRGAFGQVRLCRERRSGKIVAIKCLNKKQMLTKNQQIHLKAQKQILADGGDWIVNLLYSFQDQTNLYLVMDYLPGGDLMNLLIVRNVLTEDQARFYAAEIILAIVSIHNKNYIHRDLKPDNVLIDGRGHIKLSDFGLCKRVNKQQRNIFGYVYDDKGEISQRGIKNTKRDNRCNIGNSCDKDNKDNKIQVCNQSDIQHNIPNRRELAFSAVGTPDYIAPQMLSRTGYNQEVDWWALGIIIYQMLMGYAPFTADTNDEIYFRIENHQEYLHFPKEVVLSYDVIDLISNLLVEPGKRLGRNGVEEIQQHRWFRGINWKTIRECKPPFEPCLTAETDTRYFDVYEEKEQWLYEPKQDALMRKDFNFVGYTYKIDDHEGRDIVKEEIDRFEVERLALERPVKMDMMKKPKQNQNEEMQGNHRQMLQRIHIGDKGCHKTEINTERSRGNSKSKSPFKVKDMNRGKAQKQGMSKSPIKVEKGISLTKKAATKAANVHTLAQLYATSELNRSTGPRKSSKKL